MLKPYQHPQKLVILLLRCLLPLGLLLTSLVPLAGEATATYRLAILAFRSPEQTLARWQATAAALQTALPLGSRLELRVLRQDALDQAVARREVDYVLTQPEHYVLLRERHGLAALVTLMPLASGRPVTQFGGVIFTRAERQDLSTLDDLAGKRLMAVHEHSFGAFRMQQWELLKRGIHLPRDASSLEFSGQPQDNTVFAVLDGRADAGFVRTGVLEAMAAEGKLSLNQLKILNRQPEADFPQLLSTALYPEWPLAAMRGTPEAINKTLTLALLNLRPDSEAARQGEYYGFSPPGDYTPLEAVLLRLRVHPKALSSFEFRDVWHKYSQPLASLLVILLLLALATVWRMRRDSRLIRKGAHERSLLLSSLGEGVYGVGADGRCTFINPAALRMLGFRTEECVDRNPHQLFHHHRPDGSPYPEADCPLYQALRAGRPSRGEEYFFRADGSGFPVRFDAMPISEGHRIVGAVVCFQDISEERAAEEALRLAAVAFETQEAIVITDADNRILRVNRAFTQVTGYSPDEAIGQTTSLLKSGRHDAAFYRRMWLELQEFGRWQGEVWNRRKNGELYPEWLTITAVRDERGAIRHYVAAFLDITERKQAEAKLEYMMLYDSLTGLANRRLFLDRLAQNKARRKQGFGALLFVDIDNFRHLNDHLGHAQGDRLLVEIAERLRAASGDESTLGRVGGDDFVVCCSELGLLSSESATRAEQKAEELLASLTRPCRVGDEDCHFSACIGITLIGEHSPGPEELLKQAELAMYQAKESGRQNVRFFDPDMQSAVASRLSLEADLRQALAEQQFVLHYQPQVDGQGQIAGAEALIRWQHPERGMVSPGLFIPLAEESGLIVPLGRWILAEACRQLAEWQKNPTRQHWTLAVNISARQFHRSDFVDLVTELLFSSGATASGLKLELTESLLIEDVEDTVRKMSALRELGLTLSLDDFGTGYSSLSYLKRLPLSQLKIDQSFVRDLSENANDAAIVRAIIGMAESLGLEVIAEGVETAEQCALLQHWGCQHFQGYHFYRPLPPEVIAQLAHHD